MASLPLAFAGGWAEAATCAHALPESFPLLRGHMLPALGHATAEFGATGTVESQSAEENPAQCQNSNRLPEGNLAPAEERGQEPIPQLQHYYSADGDKQQYRQNRQRTQENPFPSHLQFLMLS